MENVATINKVPRKRVLTPMPLLDEELVLAEFAKAQIKPSHAYSMWRQILHKKVKDVDTIPNLPKKAYALIRDKFVLTTSKVLSTTTSSDKSTTKLVIELQDGRMVETVIMRYGQVQLSSRPAELQEKDAEDFRSSPRATVCISSQVGCQMGCTFCATGTMGLTANLTAGEILEQLYWANQVEDVRNVVFMGMGEPLDNYSAVIAAIRAMTDVQRFSLSPARISVSTVGVVPRLRTLANDAPGVSLALSLHAPNQKLRSQIVPSSAAWPIERIMDAMDTFVQIQNNRKNAEKTHVLIVYVLIADINDSVKVAHEMGQLLENRNVVVNVIPYNPTDVPHDYKPPSRDVTNLFCDTIRGYGLRVILRQELGQDINSACGQLVIDSQKASGCSTEKGGDIEDLMKKSTPKAATAKAKASGTGPGVEKDVSESKSFLQEHALLLCVLGGLTAFALARRLSAA